MVTYSFTTLTLHATLITDQVKEEIEHGLQRGMRSFSRSSSFRIIQALEEPRPTLQLKFPKKLSLPIFTGSRILDIDGNPLELILVDTRGNQIIQSSISNPIKIEIVVLDGDFPHGSDGEGWRSEEFERSIVRERKGKRPLLTGDVNVTMRDGFAAIGEIEFTDNSSWIRSRKFRIAAKVVQGTTRQGVKIGEAITEALVVKDHRGECELIALYISLFISLLTILPIRLINENKYQN